MSERDNRGDWRSRCEHAWNRVRDAIYDAVNRVLGPPPPDVIEKIEDVMGRAKHDFNHEKEIPKCRDEDSGKQ